MVAEKTYRDYIIRCDQILQTKDNDAAFMLATEIVSALHTDLKGLTHNLAAYTGGDGNYLEDITKLRARLQKELDAMNTEEHSNPRTQVFISHRSIDASIADMIKDFLVGTGIPNDKIFCSSLPGNDVNEKISPEVKQRLKDASVIILILSKDYYESAFCLNEAGVAWYLDDVVSIPIGLPEISHDKMVGFLNSDYKLRRLDVDGDISYLYDAVHEKLNTSSVKHGVITQEMAKLKERYLNNIGNRATQSNKTEPVQCKIPKDNYILLADIMLLYAAENDGTIVVSKTLSGSTYVTGNRYNMNASQKPREIALCDAAIEHLVKEKLITHTASSKDRVSYNVSTKGFDVADGFKETNNLDPNKPPEEIMKEFGLM